MAVKKSKVNEANNYTKPTMRKQLFEKIKAGDKGGKPSTQGPKATGERYLPAKAIKALSSEEYAKTSAKKRKDTKAGKQFSKQPDTIAKKTRRHRKS